MAKAIVIADDLTGSNATGVLLKKNGFDTYTVLNAADASNPALQDCDCLVISTGSRSIPSGEAYDSVKKALAPMIRSDVRLYAKRIDSTLRGNLGSETDAFLDLLGEKYVAVCVPCFPSSGRVLVGGYLLVNGVPLQNTEVAKDPKCPISTSSAKALYMAQSKYPVATVHLDDIAKDEESLCETVKRLVADGSRILICDSVTYEDMDTIAGAMTRSGIPFIPVDPGMFTAISAKKLLPVTRHADAGKVLCVIGSVNGVAARQVRTLLSGLPVYNVTLEVSEILESAPRRDREIERVVRDIREHIDNSDVLSVVGSGIDPDRRVPFEPYMERDGLTMEELSERISGTFAEVADRIFTQEPAFRGLYSTGGDITAAINARFQTLGLRLFDEVVPLGGYGELVGGRFPGLKFISKGGMVGDDSAMITCVRYLKEKL